MMDVVFFYGVKNVNGEFSNHYLRNFKVNGNTFSCVEQYIMAQKALIFRDLAAFNKIMNSKDPAEMKRLGHQIEGFKAWKWADLRMKIVKNAVMAKFSQNWDLRKKLLATGEAVIAMSNPNDAFWGIGMCKSDKEVLNKVDKWGKTMMGRILMEVRDELMGETFEDEMEEVSVVEEEMADCKVPELEGVSAMKVVKKGDMISETAKKVKKGMISKGMVCELVCELWQDKKYKEGVETEETEWKKVKAVKIGEFVSAIAAEEYAKKHKMSGLNRKGRKLVAKMKMVKLK